MESDFADSVTPPVPVTNHATDNAADRRNGEQWERAFCRLAGRFGKVLSPHQIASPDKPAAAYGLGTNGRWKHYLLPDVTIWSTPGEHHEIRNKRRTENDECYGLEHYRLNALVRWANTTGQRVYYTIHDWEVAGGLARRMRRCLMISVTGSMPTSSGFLAVALGCRKTEHLGSMVKQGMTS